MENTHFELWATREFGDAMLGDERRTKRLVQMAARAAAAPAGRVTEVYSETDEREAAFRFLENDAIAVDAIRASAGRAAARRCWGVPYALVPVDGSSLNLSDPSRRKDLGVVGSRWIGAQGLCVMTAIALLPDGTPTGLVGQRFWARRERSKATKNDRRPVSEKETQNWLEVMAQVRAAFASQAPTTRPWFQLDRGGDAWPVLREAVETNGLLTVRASNDRRLMGTLDGDKREYLWPTLKKRRAAGYYELDVPGGENRRARTARMKIQFCRVVLDLQDWRTKKHFFVPVWAVRSVEQHAPSGETPIEWMLLTTYPVTDLAAARGVIAGYAARWRVEEFHKAWKSGVCRVEDTMLGAQANIERWATILASVAMRAVRLTHLARTTPDAPATVELSRHEIDAVILLKKPKGVRRGATPTLAEITRWIADLGGYTGKSSGGPPGTRVIARGLTRIEPIVTVLDGGEEL